MFELDLNKANRLKLAHAFHQNKRVDYSIQCVIEGQMGKAFVDQIDAPTAYAINIGPFWYFAGEARSHGGYQLMENLPAYNFLMPSPPDWLDVAQAIFGNRWSCLCQLQPFTRYSFSAEELSQDHLENILRNSPYQEHILPLQAELAARLAGQVDSYLDVSDFDSIQDFIERGISFAAMDDGRVGVSPPMGAAWSSLVCSNGIEVSIYIEEAYRQRGVATALASRLLLECLRNKLKPNWDAANPESFKLAKKLGVRFIEAYDAYFYAPTQG